LGKVRPDPEKMAADLADEYSVLTEAVQTMMRRYRIEGAYDAIKAVSRGRSLTREEYLKLVESIKLPQEAKDRLRALTPETYTGYAEEIAGL
jgi:adenylosuccinate lyase